VAICFRTFLLPFSQTNFHHKKDKNIPPHNIHSKYFTIQTIHSNFGHQRPLMLNIILTDTTAWNDLLPLSYTRPIALLRTGILTIAEKWQKISGADVSYLTQSHLKNKFPACLADDSIVVDGSILPNKHLLVELQNLPTDTSLIHNNQWIASRLSRSLTEEFPSCTGHLAQKESVAAVLRIETLADIIRLHGTQMKLDFDLLTLGRTSEKLSETNRIIGPPNNIFVEKGAKVECATFNTEAGPIYIGEDAEVMEGSIIRGPFGMGAHAVVKMGAKIYPNVSIGPHCKLGGEAGNSILYAYSNKGHDGYLGDSYIGEWCNLGADTNTSNLKNNYAEVKLWNYPKGRFLPTGLQFCGLIMGDHSKAGINTMFNTGTVVGVSCNIFGDGYPRNFIPSFSWGGAGGLSTFVLDKATEACNAMMSRRGLQLTEADKQIFGHIYECDKAWRK